MDDRLRIFLATAPADNRYSYRSITSAGDFRLVDILPGNWDQDVAIHIDTYNLKSAPSYEALSYTWGKNSDIVNIKCNDHDLAVTSTLVTALKRIRSPDHFRKLWVDQCCIDQTNTKERSQQVTMMWQIYSSAERVLAWLGPDPRNHGATVQRLLEQISIAIDLLATLGAKMKDEHTRVIVHGQGRLVPGAKTIYELGHMRPMSRSQDFFPDIQLPVASSSDWKSLFDFFSCTYFKRLWIVQEIHAATSVILYWGQSELNWHLVFDAIRFCDIYYLRPQPESQAHWKTYVGAFVNEEEMVGAGSMLQCMVDTANHECTDNRDRVFGLLGLYKSLGSFENQECALLQSKNCNRLSADYDLTWQEVIRNTCKKICYHSTRLELLCYVTHATIPPMNGLPSWSLWSGKKPSPGSIAPECFASTLVACGDTKPRLASLNSVADNLLVARGLTVDDVLATTNAIPVLFNVSSQTYVPDAKTFEDAWALMKPFVVEHHHAWSMMKSFISHDAEGLEMRDKVLSALIPGLQSLLETLICECGVWDYELLSDVTSNSVDDVARQNMCLFASYQIENAILRMRDVCDQPDNSHLKEKLYYPEAGVFAATCCVFLDVVETDPIIIQTTLRDFVAKDVHYCRQLVDNVHETASIEERNLMTHVLVFALSVVRQRQMNWEDFGDRCWNGEEGKFFVTRNGFVGLMSPIVQSGDSICILYGGPAPFVARKCEDGANWFLGPCYLHGMMQGNAIERQEELGLVEKDFAFR